MEQMHNKEKKPTLEELHRAAHKNKPKRWYGEEEWLDKEWYDDDADCFCD